jgi:hypothetical protein
MKGGGKMKRALGLCAFALVLVYGLTMTGVAAAKTGKSVDIVGKVETGKIVADNGKEYFVSDNAKGKELMQEHMGHKVEVKGKLTEKNGKDTIDVSSIKHLSSS